jgi:hypothetical protein
VKYETKKIVMANPTKKGLIDNLLPIWMGRELEKKEGRIFMSANKKTIIRNTKIRLKMTQKMMKPVLKAIKSNRI